jgi:SNF2 family DNA or RNA helicase
LYPNYLTSYDLYEEQIKKKVAPYFLRRRKQDVLKDLPPKTKTDIWLEMSEEQKAEYNRAEREIVSEIEGLGEKVTKQHIFAKMQRLKQICNFPSGKNTSPKLDALKEQVEDISESGNKVIVFSQYIDQGVSKLVSSLNSYGTAIIVGGQSDLSRQTEIERFKHSNKTSVLVASLRAGGEGLNLTEASYVVHFDHWWNPAVMWQAEDRVHRRGQIHNVNVYSYWMNETIDE